MPGANSLPDGQIARDDFPRFGLTPFARKFPKNTDQVKLIIGGCVDSPITISAELSNLERVSQTSDFHCVTTWSHCGLHWSGFRFRELYTQIIAPKAKPEAGATFVSLLGQDGYRTSLNLNDLLADDVLLADKLNGENLSMVHGGPIRLVAPAHYGYKSVKYISQIEFFPTYKNYRPGLFAALDHPRARVDHEERGNKLPNWFYRVVFRRMIKSTAALFDSELRKHQQTNKHSSPSD